MVTSLVQCTLGKKLCQSFSVLARFFLSQRASNHMLRLFFCQTKLLWLYKILWLSMKPTPVMLWIMDTGCDMEDETIVHAVAFGVAWRARTLSPFGNGCSSPFFCCAVQLCSVSLCFLAALVSVCETSWGLCLYRNVPFAHKLLPGYYL